MTVGHRAAHRRSPLVIFVGCLLLWSAVWTPAYPTPVQAAEPDEAAMALGDRFIGRWIEPEQRTVLPLSHRLTRHDGTELELGQLVGRPMAISFAYTRCTNPNKCANVIATMARLRGQLASRGLLDDVRLVIVTYDAKHDAPEDLRRYAERLGLFLDDQTLFLRPSSADPGFYRDLGVDVSINSAGVSLHTNQLLVVDREGRLARRYRTLIWDNDEVVRDLARLLLD